MSTITKDRILGKAWEAQLAMLVGGKKCWAKSVKKWLFKHQPEEVVGSLPPVQLSLKTTLQLAATYALQAPPPGFPHTMLSVKRVKQLSLKSFSPTARLRLVCRQDTYVSRVTRSQVTGVKPK